MRLLRSRVLWGLLLILVGLLFLLESLTVISLGGAWAFLFAAAGLVFGYMVIEDRERWWAVIPAMSLLGLAGLIGLSTLFPVAGGDLGAGVFLGAIGLSFWIVYLITSREQWWSIIPGGVLIALAVAIGLQPWIGENAFVGVFFGGMGLTFALVYLLRTPDSHMEWALIPAGILGVMGVIFLGLATPYANLIWPLALILVGGYILLRNARK